MFEGCGRVPLNFHWPSCILCLFQQECLVLRAQGLLPGVEVILEAPHGHLAATRSGRVHDKATLARQGTQHPGAQRQQHHGEEVHGAGHGLAMRTAKLHLGPRARTIHSHSDFSMFFGGCHQVEESLSFGRNRKICEVSQI